VAGVLTKGKVIVFEQDEWRKK